MCQTDLDATCTRDARKGNGYLVGSTIRLLELATVYWPICVNGEATDKLARNIWTWIHQVKDTLQVRTELVIGPDSNGRVGSVQHLTNLNWDVMASERQVSQHDHIRPYASELRTQMGPS